MKEYLFVLGRATELCLAEVEAVLAREKVPYKRIFSSPELFHISTSCQINIDHLVLTLGGTIKIAEVAGAIENGDKDTVINELTTLIQRGNMMEKKITFGLSGYGGIYSNDINHWSREIKDRLVGFSLKARFILPAEKAVLSSVVVNKQKLFEIILVKENDKIIFAKTLAVQDFEGWGKRDFGRPAPDPHRGMLPPKVARMMVNLGISTIQDRNENVATILDRKAILDPFCGVGTILAEGLMIGYKVIGSDQSKEAIERTKKNLGWLGDKYQVSSSMYQVFQSEATHLSEKLPFSSIDAIVTEPYLGPIMDKGRWIMDKRKLNNAILGLEKLYLGCLKDWYKILKPGGRIVIALPSFRIAAREFFVKKAIDTCENLGYTLLAGPYQYGRPQAIVVRNIYILKKSF